MSSAEADIDALESRASVAEFDIDALEGRMSSAEADIDALESRASVAEFDIRGFVDLQGDASSRRTFQGSQQLMN
jgi:hypothetical protein